MRRKKRSFLLLLIAFLSLGALGYLIVSYAPYTSIELSTFNFQLSTLVAFFFLIFLSSSFLFACLTKNTRRGIVIGIGICAYLLLRFFGLKNIFFLVILIALFVTVELFFNQQE